MDVKLRVLRDTVFKQQPIDSSKIENPDDKQEIPKGTELDVHSWANLPDENSHLRVALANKFYKQKNTWYVYKGHVELLTGEESEESIEVVEAETKPKTSTQLRTVTSCSTHVLRGLDRQIIDEMNKIIPNAMVSFEDLNVELGIAVWAFLQPRAKAALARAIQNRGRKMVVNSAYRTIAQQLLLYNHYRNRRCGIPIAARPPRSNHQSGLAIDISDFSGWRPFLEAQGWRWLGWRDRVHFDYVWGGTRDLRPTAVLAFQRLWNRFNLADQIAEDGLYGYSTELRLNRSYIEGFDISLLQFRVLRLSNPFMRGEDVRLVQQALANAGYSIVADGVYGPGSRAVVIQFQRDKGLFPDGVAGPATRASLGL